MANIDLDDKSEFHDIMEGLEEIEEVDKLHENYESSNNINL